MQTGDEVSYITDEFEPIRHDLLTAGLRAEVGGARRIPGDPRLLATLSVDGAQIGTVALDEAASPAERLAALASFTQDLVLENHRPGGRSVVWPHCVNRDHGHPMTPLVLDGVAAWVCPAVPRAAAVPVGEFRI